MKYLFLILGIIFNLNKLQAQEDPYNIASNNIRNRGGQELLSNIQSVKMDVTISSKGTKKNAIVYILDNQAYRIEFKDNPTANEYILVNNNVGYQFITLNRIDSVKELTNQEVISYYQKMDILGPLFNSKERGIDLMYLQTERCENQPCKILEYRSQLSTSPEPIKIYLTENDELMKMEEILDTENGRKIIVTEFKNYKPAKNSSAKFAYTTIQDGTTITINDLVVNPELANVKLNLTDEEIKKYSKK